VTATTEPVRVEPSPKRVRAMLGGVQVVDSTRPLLVWERPYYPTYYFPLGHVADGVLREVDEEVRSPDDPVRYDVVVGDRIAAAAARRYPASPNPELRDHVRFTWHEIDHWFEEDEEVFVHARDPHARVDILPSSRHLRVVVDGSTVAESDKPVILFETGLPPRYYFRKTDVAMELLTPTDSATQCPYKGQAEYWSVTVGGTTHTDLAWSYRSPVRESLPIAGLIAFYDEKVDTYVDGELAARPQTPFS